MKTRSFLLLGLIIPILLLAACANSPTVTPVATLTAPTATPTEPPTASYFNQELGYTLTYPAPWKDTLAFEVFDSEEFAVPELALFIQPLSTPKAERNGWLGSFYRFSRGQYDRAMSHQSSGLHSDGMHTMFIVYEDDKTVIVFQLPLQRQTSDENNSIYNLLYDGLSERQMAVTDVSPMDYSQPMSQYGFAINNTGIDFLYPTTWQEHITITPIDNGVNGIGFSLHTNPLPADKDFSGWIGNIVYIERDYYDDAMQRVPSSDLALMPHDVLKQNTAYVIIFGGANDVQFDDTTSAVHTMVFYGIINGLTDFLFSGAS